MINRSHDSLLHSTCRFTSSTLVHSALAVFGWLILSLATPVVGLAAPATVENDSATGLVNTSVIVDILANDSGDWVKGTLSQPANGTLAVLAGPIIEYTPNTDFLGIDTFLYRLRSSSGENFLATVTITVSATPALVAQDDFATTQRNTPVIVDTLANDSVNWVSGILSQPLQGTVVGLGNGIVEYTPNTDFLGSDKFTYTHTDSGGETLMATATITVLENPAPSVQDDSFHTRPDTSVALRLLANDNGDWVSGSLTQPLNGSVTNLQYTPDPGFSGADSFTYSLTDSSGLTVGGAVTVTVDNAPILKDDFAATNVDTPIVVSVSDNDDLVGGASGIFSQPAFGTVTGGGPTLTYTPNPGFTGFDRFSYTLTADNGSGSDTANVSVGVDAVVFNDVTVDSGINYVQCTGQCMSMSGGAAAGDYDGDGNVDLYVTRFTAPDILYRNNGDGTFTDVTLASGIDRGDGSNGAAWGDIDNDGDLDLYVTVWDDTRFYLFINDGLGQFTEEAVARGASTEGVDTHQGTSVSFGDYDRDGYLDIHTNEWRKDADNPTGALSNSRLLRNLGAVNPGFFEDVTASAGVALDGVIGGPEDGTFAFASEFVDMDNDGWLDLLIASDFSESRLFWNNGDGTFTDGTTLAGVGGDENGMGSATGDVNGDGFMDWFVSSIHDPDSTCVQDQGNSGTTGNRLYLNTGNRTFTDSTAAGVRDGGWGWGATFIDYDNDGDEDLIHTNGFKVHCWREDQLRFFENDGVGNFTEKASSVGLFDTGQGKGLLKFDYDNDGDLDIFIVNNGGQPVLYRNDGGNANDWLRIKFATTEQHVGARIVVETVLGGSKQHRRVSANSNFLAQDEVTAHFGLGQGASPVATVKIRMLSGTLKVFNDVPRNSVLIVTD